MESIIDELKQRHVIAQTSDEQALKSLLKSPITIYCGFDPTAISLHVGHLVPLLTLRRLQLAGHRVIAVVGGATGLIGDPSFRDSARSAQSAETTAEWAEKITQQLKHILHPSPNIGDSLVLNNCSWIENMSLLDYLQDNARHFSLNAMLNKESMRTRLEADNLGVSLAEACYMTLQSIDFYYLNRHYDCMLQIGGSDQWGNITAGIDLTRRQNQQQVHGLTTALMLKADGTKFGKTASGSLWLEPQLTSPYRFYQFWLNVTDAEVVNLLHYLSFKSLDTIKQLITQSTEDAARPRLLQEQLAAELTQLIHGEQGLSAALRITDALFSNTLQTLNASDFNQLHLDGLMSIEVKSDEKSVTELLVDSGLAVTPKGEVTLGQARKLINSNAITVNNVIITDVQEKITRASALHGRYHIIRKGKKHYCLLRWV